MVVGEHEFDYYDENVSIMQNNQEIASIFREYMAEKNYRNQITEQRNHARARKNNEKLQKEKREYDKFYLKKWAIFKQIIDFVIDRKCQILKKQRLIREWVTLCKVHHRSHRSYHNMVAQIEFKQRKLLESLQATLIKRSFKKAYLKFGCDYVERMERRIPHCVSLYTYTLNPSIKTRSKNLIMIFLR